MHASVWLMDTTPSVRAATLPAGLLPPYRDSPQATTPPVRVSAANALLFPCTRTTSYRSYYTAEVSLPLPRTAAKAELKIPHPNNRPPPSEEQSR
jgi:hypothetical protein